MKLITLLSILSFCFVSPTNAQFLKKLGEKAEAAAARALERKVEKKASDKTEEAFDSLFTEKKKKEGGGMMIPGLAKVDPASSYSFDHRALMEIKSGKEVIKINYFLPQSGNFLCMLIEDEKIKNDMLTVYDIDREAMFTYMEDKGQKSKFGVTFQMENAIDDAQQETTMKIWSTGSTKIIKGFKCEEFEMTDTNLSATIWVTKDIELRFPTDFHSIKQHQKYSSQEWMNKLDGWAMEMEMIDTSKKKPQTITMTCLETASSDLKINSSEYQGLGF